MIEHINIDIPHSFLMNTSIITKINLSIIKLLHDGVVINRIEVGSKMQEIIENVNHLNKTTHIKLPNYIGTYRYCGINIFFNKKIKNNEYNFIINYGNNDEQYIYINRDIQKEREKIIDEILND